MNPGNSVGNSIHTNFVGDMNPCNSQQNDQRTAADPVAVSLLYCMHEIIVEMTYMYK